MYTTKIWIILYSKTLFCKAFSTSSSKNLLYFSNLLINFWWLFCCSFASNDNFSIKFSKSLISISFANSNILSSLLISLVVFLVPSLKILLAISFLFSSLERSIIFSSTKSGVIVLWPKEMNSLFFNFSDKVFTSWYILSLKSLVISFKDFLFFKYFKIKNCKAIITVKLPLFTSIIEKLSEPIIFLSSFLNSDMVFPFISFASLNFMIICGIYFKLSFSIEPFTL